jgi:hypothetical protein
MCLLASDWSAVAQPVGRHDTVVARISMKRILAETAIWAGRAPSHFITIRWMTESARSVRLFMRHRCGDVNAASAEHLSLAYLQCA